jgi:hypothetical protein
MRGYRCACAECVTLGVLFKTAERGEERRGGIRLYSAFEPCAALVRPPFRMWRAVRLSAGASVRSHVGKRRRSEGGDGIAPWNARWSAQKHVGKRQKHVGKRRR